ncbi:unnamed protein product [Jaminaea pallidilutea]
MKIIYSLAALAMLSSVNVLALPTNVKASTNIVRSVDVQSTKRNVAENFSTNDPVNTGNLNPHKRDPLVTYDSSHHNPPSHGGHGRRDADVLARSAADSDAELQPRFESFPGGFTAFPGSKASGGGSGGHGRRDAEKSQSATGILTRANIPQLNRRSDLLESRFGIGGIITTGPDHHSSGDNHGKRNPADESTSTQTYGDDPGHQRRPKGKEHPTPRRDIDEDAALQMRESGDLTGEQGRPHHKSKGQTTTRRDIDEDAALRLREFGDDPDPGHYRGSDNKGNGIGSHRRSPGIAESRDVEQWGSIVSSGTGGSGTGGGHGRSIERDTHSGPTWAAGVITGPEHVHKGDSSGHGRRFAEDNEKRDSIVVV